MARSAASATSKSRSSSWWRASTCIPTGSPSTSPAGIDTAGLPYRFEIIVSAPMLTSSGKPLGREREQAGGQAGERGGGDAHRRERAAEREPARAARQGGVDDALLRRARRRVGRERDVGVRRRDHEVDLRERRGHRRVRLEAELLGDRRGLQVVERLRHVEAARDFVGELAGRSAATGRRARRAASRGCPSSTARRGSGASRSTSTSTSPSVSMSSLAASRTRCSTSGATAVTPPRSGRIATRRPRRSCVPRPASHPPGDGQARRIAGS